jgi:hypothetical protein
MFPAERPLWRRLGPVATHAVRHPFNFLGYIRSVSDLPEEIVCPLAHYLLFAQSILPLWVSVISQNMMSSLIYLHLYSVMGKGTRITRRRILATSRLLRRNKCI